MREWQLIKWQTYKLAEKGCEMLKELNEGEPVKHILSE